MVKNTSRHLLERSCGWIKDHWDAKNVDVPDEFLHQWIYDHNEDYVDPTGFYLAVFSFGYLQHELMAKGVPFGAKRSVPVSLLMETFQLWQLKLALVELHRVTNLRFRPMALFEFPDDERIEAWKDA
jgi:hypothetical protein